MLFLPWMRRRGGRSCQEEVAQAELGHFGDAQTAAQHEQEDGPVADVVDDGEQLLDGAARGTARAGVGVAQQVAVAQDGALEGGVLVGQEVVEGGDGGQAAVDGAAFEAALGLERR